MNVEYDGEELLEKMRKRGLVNDEQRRLAWMKLWKVKCNFCIDDEPDWNEEKVELHGEYCQVQSDVSRTLLRFPPELCDDDRQDLLSRLLPIVVSVLIANPQANYYQGFHDVCLTILLVLDDCSSTQFICNCLAKTYFSNILVEPMENTYRYIEKVLYAIVAAEDYELYNHFIKNEMPAVFALSWVITWFAHDCNDLKVIVRLYDLFMASIDEMPLYVAASLLLMNRQRIKDVGDSGELFKELLSLPKKMNTSQCIEQSLSLLEKHPPQTLQSPDYWRPSWFSKVPISFICTFGVAVSATLFYFVYNFYARKSLL